MEAFFKPKSVAVVGASATPGKLGYTVVENIINSGFKGDIYPINPSSPEILGLKAYPAVGDVPGAIDQAIIVVPAKFVKDLMVECGEKGVKAVTIITAGFREVDHEGLETEMAMVEIAKKYGMRIVGPNCLGVIDTRTPFNGTFAAGSPPQGPMSFMSQSGALGTAVLDWSKAGRMGFNKFASLGNKADVNEIDLINDWSNDHHSRVIVAYMEGVPDGQKFIETARIASKKKPIVVVKSGITSAGSRAVSSHTGSLAGSEQAYATALKQAGVIRATTLQEMFDFATAFATQPEMKGDRVAVVTNAGGPGILATDALVNAGLTLATLSEKTIQELDAYLPVAASSANPVDVLGDAKTDRYEFAIRKVVEDKENVDAVMIIMTPQAMTEIAETAEKIVDIAAEADIPIVAAFLGDAEISKGVKLLNAGGVPNFATPEPAANALSAMYRYHVQKMKPLPSFETFKVDKEAVRKVFDNVKEGEGRDMVVDYEARGVLEAYGIPVPRAKVCATPAEAVKYAETISYPIVLKIASPDVLHKTEVGGVKVNIKTPEQLAEEFDKMVTTVSGHMPDARILGCLVQEMAPWGHEVLVGMNRDPQFGPLVTFGLGGTTVELFKDVTFRIPPYSRDEVWEMMDEVKSGALLKGYRGAPPADLNAVVDIVMRIGQLVMDFPEIVEMDINPLMVYDDGQGAIALDLRLILD